MVSITTLASFNIYNALEECIEDELEDFNNAPFPLDLNPNWCKQGIISTIQGSEFCCVEQDCKDQCDNTYPTNGGFDCCTPENKCGIGEGDCDTDLDCSGLLICGNDNCGSQFGWVDAPALLDCCYFILDSRPQPIIPASRCTGCTFGQISSKIGSTICQTVDQVGCKIDRSVALLTIPVSNPCTDVALSFQGALERQNPLESSGSITTFLTDVGNDIELKFTCLYYFYFVDGFGANKKCDNLGILQNALCSACTAGVGGGSLVNAPIFDLTGFTVDSQIVVLPSRPDRITGASRFGKFLLDERWERFNEPGADFITKVFEEYMGCAVSRFKSNLVPSS